MLLVNSDSILFIIQMFQIHSIYFIFYRINPKQCPFEVGSFLLKFEVYIKDLPLIAIVNNL
jgi:hypothetical protein